MKIIITQEEKQALELCTHEIYSCDTCDKISKGNDCDKCILSDLESIGFCGDRKINAINLLKIVEVEK